MYIGIAVSVRQKTPGQNLKVPNYETEQLIGSGDIFTITTDNKVERPLPSMDLLEMLWILKRIAAIQGAAETEEDDTEEDDVESDNDSPSVPDTPL